MFSSHNIHSLNTDSKTIASKCKQDDKRPYINVIIGDKTFSCLLDSGATASVCNSFGADIFSSMGFKKLKGQQISSTLADGSSQRLSDFFSIPVRFETTFSIIKFYIMPNCNNKFLLGNDFCMNAEIVMSYKNKKWHYDTNTEKELENGLNDYSHLNNEEKNKLSKIVAKFNQLWGNWVEPINIHTKLTLVMQNQSVNVVTQFHQP